MREFKTAAPTGATNSHPRDGAASSIPLWDVDGDPALRELLARPVEVPAQAPQVVQLPELSPEAVVLDELDAAAITAVRTLRHAMTHGESTSIRVSAARAVLQASMARWSGRVAGDALGDVVRSVYGTFTTADPDGRRSGT